MWVSVTRLRLRSVRHLPAFLRDVLAINRQARQSGGFISGKLLVDRGLTFWTMTAWKNEASMRTFRASAAHARTMPKLSNWCREAGFAGWEQAGPELPSWAEGHRRIQMTVHPARKSQPVPPPRVLPLLEARLRPRVPASGRAAAAGA